MTELEGFVRPLDTQEPGHWPGATVQGLVQGVMQSDPYGRCVVVALTGSWRGLIPEGEVGAHPWGVLDNLVGRTVLATVLTADQARKTAVLSRRKVQVEQAERTWAALKPYVPALKDAWEAVIAARQHLQKSRQADRHSYLAAVDRVQEAGERLRAIGPVLPCVVRQVSAERAVVDIGGVLASLPATEVAHHLVKDCREYLTPGDGFDVRVVGIVWERRTVHVSRRALLPDPWKWVEKDYTVGGKYLGRVARVSADVVYVELDRPGIYARVDPFYPMPAVGDSVIIAVRKVSAAKRWIGARFLARINVDQ